MPSPRSRARQRRARRLSAAFRAGDGDAGYSLLQRARALIGIQKLGWEWRLALANAARARNLERRRREKDKAAFEKRELVPFMESTRNDL